MVEFKVRWMRSGVNEASGSFRVAFVRVQTKCFGGIQGLEMAGMAWDDTPSIPSPLTVVS